MGGAPSLPEALEGLPTDAVYISANHHGALLRKVDFIVYVDRLHQVTGQPMRYLLKKYDAPLVSIRQEADYQIPRLFDGNSGLQAILFACLAGCNPVIVTGIEMFKGKTYFHNKDYPSSGFDKDKDLVNQQVETLVEITKGCNVVQVNCNLPFPKYDKNCHYPMPPLTPLFSDIMGF